MPNIFLHLGLTEYPSRIQHAYKGARYIIIIIVFRYWAYTARKYLEKTRDIILRIKTLDDASRVHAAQLRVFI